MVEIQPKSSLAGLSKTYSVTVFLMCQRVFYKCESLSYMRRGHITCTLTCWHAVVIYYVYYELVKFIPLPLPKLKIEGCSLNSWPPDEMTIYFHTMLLLSLYSYHFHFCCIHPISSAPSSSCCSCFCCHGFSLSASQNYRTRIHIWDKS